MLNADPVNPEANAAQGKFLCFVKDDWDKGVLMLALGNVPELKAIAEKELDELSPVPPLQIADGWWKLAEKQQGIIKTRMCRWAARWYRQALPELSGLEKDAWRCGFVRSRNRARGDKGNMPNYVTQFWTWSPFPLGLLHCAP